MNFEKYVQECDQRLRELIPNSDTYDKVTDLMSDICIHMIGDRALPPLAFVKAKDQYPALCKAAVWSNTRSVEFIKERTSEIDKEIQSAFLYAVENEVYVPKEIKDTRPKETEEPKEDMLTNLKRRLTEVQLNEKPNGLNTISFD